MKRRRFASIRPSSWAPLAALAVALLSAGPAQASEITDIVDAFERGSDRAVDVTVGLKFESEERSGLIQREFRCLSHDLPVQSYCPDRSGTILVNELKTATTKKRLNIDARLGFWRMAAIRLRLPILLEEQTTLEFDDSGSIAVDNSNSSVDPGGVQGIEGRRPTLFDVANSGPRRSGVADPSIEVRFAPLNFARDPARATWTIAVDLTAPLAPPREATNDAPGEGLWKIGVSSAVSGRTWPFLEPYLQIGGRFQIPAANSVFKDYGRTQNLFSPGHEVGVWAGIEAIAFETVEDESGLYFDVGGHVKYRFQGRDYTDLFDALGTSECDPRSVDSPCELTTFTRGDIDIDTGQRRKTDGVTDVEGYATTGFMLSARYQPFRYLSIAAHFGMSYEFPHFLTNADVGKDLGGPDGVQFDNDPTSPTGGENEYNPVYAEAIDAVGNRFRTANMVTYQVGGSIEAKF